MRAKMKSAPVYYVIVQVRFNPILSLDTYAAQIQERLRKEGFPDAQRGFLATINAAPTRSRAARFLTRPIRGPHSGFRVFCRVV
jgi:uncharacterized protein (TIGR04255 family)